LVVPPDAYDHDAWIAKELGVPTHEDGKLNAYVFAVVSNVAVTPLLAPHVTELAEFATAPPNCPATTFSVAPYD
jgi:hypothetical protein